MWSKDTTLKFRIKPSTPDLAAVWLNPQISVIRKKTATKNSNMHKGKTETKAPRGSSLCAEQEH